MEKRRVLITGLGTVNPLGHNAADTWQAVRDGVCGIGPITRYDCSAQKVHLAAEVKDWDPTTVRDKKDVRHMSRYTQLAAAAAKEALADSGLDREKEDLTRCGVIVSSGVGGIEMAESEELRCSQKGFDRAWRDKVIQMQIPLFRPAGDVHRPCGRLRRRQQRGGRRLPPHPGRLRRGDALRRRRGRYHPSVHRRLHLHAGPPCGG